METYIRKVKHSDVIDLIENEEVRAQSNINNDGEATFLIQVFLIQNIEDIGIYDDLDTKKRSIITDIGVDNVIRDDNSVPG
jgi:hypothetical protein